ncbi:MAG: hypothetical protein CSYNP_00389 [Syntrophus sp. SKADARSKE-3]|nr:hypothetical protein [Syntrophus sp. SKADARSKE-3]
MKRVMKIVPLGIISVVLITFLVSGCGSGGPSAPSAPVQAALGSGPVVLMSSSPQLNSDGATTVTLTALVRDSSNRAMANQTVAFSASSGNLVVTSSTTDTNGQATATLGTGFDPTNRDISVSATSGSYSAATIVSVVNTNIDISGLSSLSLNDSVPLIITLKDSSGKGIAGKTVTVTSRYGNPLSASSFVTNSSGQITVNVTAAKQAMFISLASDNKVSTLSSRYQKDYVALVTDVTGAPIVGATITPKVKPVYYRKGYYQWSTAASMWSLVPTLVAASSTLPAIPACANEDSITHNPLYDYNGVLDPGEDVNNNGRLDPGNVASVTATTTDSTGHSVVSVVYARDYASWVNVKLEAWASLNGSTTSASATFTLPGVNGDYLDQTVIPPGYTSPFGASSTCYADLFLVPVSLTEIDLNWLATSQAINYRVYRNAVLRATVTTNSFADIGLTTNQTYCYNVNYVDALGIERKLADQVCGTTLVPVTVPPAAPTGLVATAASSSQINLVWNNTLNAAGYKVYRGVTYVKSITTNGTTDTGLSSNTQYCYAVTSYDSTGTESAKSTTSCATTNVTTPAVPSGIVATPISQTQINLTWIASAGAAGYNLYRTGGGATVTLSTTAANISDVSCTKQTQYCYSISAFDVSGNESAKSSPVCTATQ